MRYALTKTTDELQHPKFDVLIVGGGIAGLYTALHIDERYRVCLLTKESVEISNSWLAQGGIAAAIANDDKPIFHASDTLIAGAGLCDESAVKTLVEEGPTDIRSLQDMAVPFDLSDEGQLQITREGGHRRNRIVHAGGDATGRETVKVLARQVAARPNVSFIGPSFFVDIITDDRGVTGAIMIGPDDQSHVIDCPNIVIATGGVGQIYKSSTNPSVATGDGIAAALRAGASLKGMEFIQFHPTGLWSKSGEGQAFLISEAVRGEGGLLKNANGERFMESQHELAELAPRDIVARGIVRELEKNGGDHVFVDITDKSAEFLSHRFPTIYGECLSRGIDISKQPIPVCPVQHYLIGGIETDLHACTSVAGLFACGEAAATGVHGANRLASNSMLECLVFGRHAALQINERLRLTSRKKASAQLELPERDHIDLDFAEMRRELQALMSEHCGVIRTKAGLEHAVSQLDGLLAKLESGSAFSRQYVELLNLATVARSIATSALARRESVGAHYRED